MTHCQPSMLIALLVLSGWGPCLAAEEPAEKESLSPSVGVFLTQYCVKCHGEAKAEADLHLDKLAKTADVGGGHETWLKVAKAIERREMPPDKAKQPPDDERAAAARATRTALKAFYARTADGDPGEVVLRRLTNAEYDYSVQDLTGIAIKPSWRFPRNETSGEGFDNVAAALGVRSSSLIEKYLEAAEEVADHAFMQPGRGLVFSRLTHVQSSRPQRTLEACEELKRFYDRIATELPKRASLAKGLVAAWQFQHRGQFADASLDDLAKQRGVDPRYARWLWSQLHDKGAGAFQRQLLQERFMALPAAQGRNGNLESVVARCQRIADDVALALHAPIGLTLKDLPNPTPYYLQGRREIAQAQKSKWRFNAGEAGGMTVYLVAGDAGIARPADDPARPFVIWQDLRLDLPNKRQVSVGDLLKKQSHPQVLFDRLPNGRKLGANEFAVPVPSLIRIELSAELAPPKSGCECQGKFQLAEHPGCVAQVGVLSDEVVAREPPGADGPGAAAPGGIGLTTGSIVPGAELRAAGDPAAFDAAWRAYDDFFQRFALPYFPTLVDLDIAPRNGFPDAIGIYAVYGIPPERRLHRFEHRDEWLKACVLTPEESRQLDALWDDAFYLADEHTQRLARLARRHGLHDLPRAEQEAALARLTEPESRPRESPTWGGRPYYFRQPDPPAQRLESLRAAPAQAEAAHRRRSQAELLALADRAWRRPLDADEQRALSQDYQRLRDEGLDDEAALRRSIIRVLVSPNFLLKVERGTAAPLVGENKPIAQPATANELASRLSYFLWSSVPDAELRASAADGSLLRDDVLRRQALRMLRDPRARRLAVEFFGQWLAFKDFDRHSRTDRQRFPEFSDDLRQEMYDETVLFLDDVIRNDRTVRDMFFGTHTFLNVSLALHYGLDPRKLPWPPDAPRGYRDDWTNRERIARERAKGTPLPLVRVEVDPKQRGGLLGMGSVLTAQSLSLRTSPVNRGKWLYEAVLGREIPDPPANAGVLPDDDQQVKKLTLREQLEQHRLSPACASCHARFDPLGLALERYDAIGRLRDRDSADRAIDDRGELGGAPVVGLPGVRAYLAAHEDELLRNFSRKLLGFALGRALQPADELLIDRMRAAGDGNEQRFSSYVTTIVLSPPFRNRRTK